MPIISWNPLDDIIDEEERLRRERQKQRDKEAAEKWKPPSWTTPAVEPEPQRVGLYDLTVDRVDTGTPSIAITETEPTTVTLKKEGAVSPLTLEPRPLSPDLQLDREKTYDVPLVRRTSDLDTEDRYKNFQSPALFYEPEPQVQPVEPWRPPDVVGPVVDFTKQYVQQPFESGLQAMGQMGLNIAEDVVQARVEAPGGLYGGAAAQYVAKGLGETPAGEYWEGRYTTNKLRAPERNMTWQQGWQAGWQAPWWAQAVGSDLGLDPQVINNAWLLLFPESPGVMSLWGLVDKPVKYAGAPLAYGVDVVFDVSRAGLTMPADQLAMTILGQGDDYDRTRMLPPIAGVSAEYAAAKATGQSIWKQVIEHPTPLMLLSALMGGNTLGGVSTTKAVWSERFASEMEAYRQVQRFFDQATPEEREKYDIVWTMSFSGGIAVRDALQAMIMRDPLIAALKQQIEETAPYDPLRAAQLGMEVYKLQQMTDTELIEQYLSIDADLLAGIFLDPAWGFGPWVLGQSLSLGKYQTEAFQLFRVGTADEATRVLDEATRAAEPVLAAVRKGMPPEADALHILDPKTWWKPTPYSAANNDTDWLHSTVDLLLSQVTTKGDASLVLNALQKNAGLLMEPGLPLNSPTIIGFKPGDLVKFNPGIVANEGIAARYPILSLLPDDWVNELRSLKGEGAFNKSALYAELDELFYRTALQYHGLNLISGAPPGTADLRLKSLPDGNAVVEFVGPKGNVLGASNTMPLDEATRQIKVAQDAKKKYGNIFQLLGRGFGWFVNMQRGMISDAFLLTPRQVIRNAGGGIANALGLDAYSWLSKQSIIDDVAKDFGGIVPTERGLAAQTGYERGFGGGLNQPSQGFLGWLGQAVTGDPDNPLSEMMRFLYKIPFGETEARVGKHSAGGGEEINRLKSWYEGYRKTKYRLLENGGEQMIAALKQLPNPPDDEWLAGLEAIYVEYGQKGTRRQLYDALFNYTNNDQANAVTLYAMGIDPNQFSLAGWNQLMDTILKPIDNLSHEEYVRAVNQLLDDESRNLWRALTVYPPEMGVVAWSDVVAPTEAALVRTQLTGAARQAGVDPANVSDQIDAVVQAITQGESVSWEAFRTDLGNLLPSLPHEQQEQLWAIALDFWQDTLDAKQLARTRSSRAAENALYLRTPEAWQKKFQETAEAWAEYGQTVTNLAEESRTALSTVSAGGTYSPKGSPYTSVLRWLEYDPAELEVARSLYLGAPTLENTGVWARRINANRAYVDHSTAYLFDAFRRYPTSSSFDLVVQALKEMDEVGRKAAVATSDFLAQNGGGAVYWVFRDSTWDQSFDRMVAIAQAYSRSIVSNAVMEKAGQAIEWTDDFMGGRFRLRFPNQDGTWTAMRLDDQTPHVFDAPNGSMAIPKVPDEVVRSFLTAAGGEGLVDEVMGEVAQTVGPATRYVRAPQTPTPTVPAPRRPPAAATIMPGSLEAPLVTPSTPPRRPFVPADGIVISRDDYAKTFWDGFTPNGRRRGLGYDPNAEASPEIENMLHGEWENLSPGLKQRFMRETGVSTADMDEVNRTAAVARAGQRTPPAAPPVGEPPAAPPAPMAPPRGVETGLPPSDDELRRLAGEAYIGSYNPSAGARARRYDNHIVNAINADLDLSIKTLGDLTDEQRVLAADALRARAEGLKQGAMRPKPKPAPRPPQERRMSPTDFLVRTKDDIVQDYGPELRARGLSDEEIGRMSKEELRDTINRGQSYKTVQEPTARPPAAPETPSPEVPQAPTEVRPVNMPDRWWLRFKGMGATDEELQELDRIWALSDTWNNVRPGVTPEKPPAGVEVMETRRRRAMVSEIVDRGRAEAAPAPAPKQPTTPAPETAAGQAEIFAEGEDLPAMTGGVYGPRTEAFAPEPIEATTGKLFDTRPVLGQTEPTYRPMQEAIAEVDPSMTKQQIVDQYGDVLKAQGMNKTQIGRMSKAELIQTIDEATLDTKDVVMAGLRGGLGMSKDEAREAADYISRDWDRVASGEHGLGGIKGMVFGYGRGQKGRINLLLDKGEVTKFRDLYGTTIAGRRIDDIGDVEDLFNEYRRALDAMGDVRKTDAQERLFEKLTTKQIVDAVAGDLKRAGFSPDQLTDLASQPKDQVLEYLRGFFGYSAGEPTVRMVDFDFAVPNWLELDDERNLYQKLRDTIFRSRRSGGTKPPEPGDVTRGLIDDLEATRRKLINNEDVIRKGNVVPNVLTPAQRLKVWDVVKPYATSWMDNILGQALYVGGRTSDFVMMNMRTGNRYVDNAMRYGIPFHYFVSRMPSRLAQLVVNNPPLVNLFWEVESELNRWHERKQSPVRLEGKIPLGNLPQGQGELFAGNPMAYLVPYSNYAQPNPYLSPENASGPLESNINQVRQWNPMGMMPYLELGLAMLLDWLEPLPNGEKRVDDFELGDYNPYYRTAGYAVQAATGQVGPTEGPFQWFGPQGAGYWGDDGDYWRAVRAAGSIALERGLPEGIGEAAEQIIQNRYFGKEDGFALDMVPPDLLDQAMIIADQAIKSAGLERLITVGSSLLTGVPFYWVRPGEQQGREINRTYPQLGYSDETPYGSKEGQSLYVEGIPGIGAWWAKNNALPGVAAQLSLLFNQYGQLKEEQAQAEADAVNALPRDATMKEMGDARRGVREEYKARRDELQEQIADLKAQERGGGPVGPGWQGVPEPQRYMNPKERADNYAQAMLYAASGLPGKPVRPPDEEQNQAIWRKYGADQVKYEDDQINYLLRSMTGKLPVSEAARERRGNKEWTREEVEELWWKWRNEQKEPWERARYETLDRESVMYDTQSEVSRKRARERVENGDILLQKYLDTPRGDAREKLRDTDWRYSAVTMAAYNPDIWDTMVDKFGEDAVSDYYKGRGHGPEWPGEDATEKQIDAYWEARNEYDLEHPYMREIDLWLNGRDTFVTFDMRSRVGGDYDAGRQYEQAVKLFGPRIFDIERESIQASADDKWRVWKDGNRADWALLVGFQDWSKGLKGMPESTAQLPKARWGIEPNYTPVPPDMLQRSAQGTQGNRLFLPTGADTGLPGREPMQITPGGLIEQGKANLDRYLQEFGSKPAEEPGPAAPPGQGLGGLPVSPRDQGPGVEWPEGPQLTPQEWAMQNESFRKTLEWDARKAAVNEAFGTEVGSLYEQYLALPKGDPRSQFKAEHPELRAVSIFTWNPNEYQQMQELFGQEAIMVWASTPAWADNPQSRQARSDYYDNHPAAFEINAWIYGRPKGMDESDVVDDETFEYNFGKDYEEAKRLFGGDIWQVVGGYKRGWDKKAKADYFDTYPQLSGFFDWWYAGLPGQEPEAASRGGYGFGGYGGGGGGGGDYEYEGGVDNYVQPRSMLSSLWQGPQRYQPRQLFNATEQWLRAGERIGPKPMQRWQPPRWGR